MLKYSDYFTYDNWKFAMEQTFNNIQCSIPENRITSSYKDSLITPGIYPTPFNKRILYRPLSFSMNWEVYAYNYPTISKEFLLKYED